MKSDAEHRVPDDDAPIDAEIARISRRIRRWREQAELTLQELARRSGLAPSTIQKIETGQMIPSVAVLLKVARGLGRRASEFVHDGDASLEVVRTAAGERHAVGLRDRMWVERLSADLFEPALEMWRVVLQPGVSSGAGSIQYDGEELVVCEEGSVVFRVGDEEHVLEAGDTLHFKAAIPHSWRNEGAALARFTITGTLPHKFRALLQSRVSGVESRGAR